MEPEKGKIIKEYYSTILSRLHVLPPGINDDDYSSK
jgi:hypothetical protein